MGFFDSVQRSEHEKGHAMTRSKIAGMLWQVFHVVVGMSRDHCISHCCILKFTISNLVVILAYVVCLHLCVRTPVALMHDRQASLYL